jgi:hypothetical protein
MDLKNINRNSSFVSCDEPLDRRVGEADDPLAACSEIREGARAVNRLLWSLGLLLLPLVLPSSDWVGLMILSQAFFVAAKLIKPAFLETNSAVSPTTTVITMKQGEDCAQ